MTKRKPFVELGNKPLNNITNDILQTITSFVDELNQDVENPMTITQFLGYLIHRINYAENKKTAEIGLSLFLQHENAKMSFNETEAISLMHELTLSKYQMIKVKAYLSYKQIYFPNQKLLLPARQKLRPPIRNELDGDGVSVNYGELFKETTKSLIETITKISQNVIIDTREIKAVYKVEMVWIVKPYGKVCQQIIHQIIFSSIVWFPYYYNKVKM